MHIHLFQLKDSLDGYRYLARPEFPEYVNGTYLYPYLVETYLHATGEIIPIRVATFDDIPTAIHAAFELAESTGFYKVEVTFDVPEAPHRAPLPTEGGSVVPRYFTVHNGHQEIHPS